MKKIVFLQIFITFTIINAFPEQGIFNINLNKDRTQDFITKSLYNNTPICLQVECDNTLIKTKFKLTWMIRETKCLTDIFALQQFPDEKDIFDFLCSDIQDATLYSEFSYMTNTVEANCGEHIQIPDISHQNHFKVYNRTDNDCHKIKSYNSNPKINDSQCSNQIYKSWTDGLYIFAFKFEELESIENINLSIVLKLKGKHGYLSAIDWPLLPFYSVMCVVYIIFGIVWLVMCAFNWRDLLRIQFWISAVIFLGLVEKAVYIGEYRTLSDVGKSVKGAIFFALFITSIKRALARILIVIACLGYGIVKPRLGTQLQRVLALSFFFFCFSYADEIQKILKHRGYNKGQNDLFTAVPLAIIDALFCWWIFTSLIETMKTLKIRKNVVKLSLYRHFTNTLILAVFISIAYMVWSIVQHKFAKCLDNWNSIWIDEAFWHFNFSFILGIIIFLWRPSNNEQRFASTPLLDDVDDEYKDETNLNESFATQKRQITEINGNKKKIRVNKAEEDLKWIEENIPASLADSALPNVIDSDEEILNTRLQLSKME